MPANRNRQCELLKGQLDAVPQKRFRLRRHHKMGTVFRHSGHDVIKRIFFVDDDVIQAVKLPPDRFTGGGIGMENNCFQAFFVFGAFFFAAAKSVYVGGPRVQRERNLCEWESPALAGKKRSTPVATTRVLERA